MGDRTSIVPYVTHNALLGETGVVVQMFAFIPPRLRRARGVIVLPIRACGQAAVTAAYLAKLAKSQAEQAAAAIEAEEASRRKAAQDTIGQAQALAVGRSRHRWEGPSYGGMSAGSLAVRCQPLKLQGHGWPFPPRDTDGPQESL
jgi:hypothetical protein